MSDAHKRNLAVPFFTQRDNTYATVSIEKWGKYFKQTKENYLLVSDDF